VGGRGEAELPRKCTKMPQKACITRLSHSLERGHYVRAGKGWHFRPFQSCCSRAKREKGKRKMRQSRTCCNFIWRDDLATLSFKERAFDIRASLIPQSSRPILLNAADFSRGKAKPRSAFFPQYAHIGSVSGNPARLESDFLP